MDAVEHLPRLDDALRRSARQLNELALTRSIDAGKAKNLNGNVIGRTEGKPRLFGLCAFDRARIGRCRRGLFVNPRAFMIAIDTDGREISDPAQLGSRCDLRPVSREHRIATGAGRHGNQQCVGGCKICISSAIALLRSEYMRIDTGCRQYFCLFTRAHRSAHMIALSDAPSGEITGTESKAEDKQIHEKPCSRKTMQRTYRVG